MCKKRVVFMEKETKSVKDFFEVIDIDTIEESFAGSGSANWCNQVYWCCVNEAFIGSCGTSAGYYCELYYNNC